MLAKYTLFIINISKEDITDEMLANLLFDSGLSDAELSNSGRCAGSIFYSIAQKISKASALEKDLQNTAKRLKTRWLRRKSKESELNFDCSTIVTLLKNSGSDISLPFHDSQAFFEMISASFCSWASPQQIESHWNKYVKSEYEQHILNVSQRKTVLLTMSFERSEIFNNNGVLKGDFNDFLLTNLSKIKPKCTVRFETRKVESKLPIYVTLSCTVPNCRVFNCRIGHSKSDDNLLELIVNTKDEFNQEKHKTTIRRRQLRGQMRVATKAKLKFMKAARVQAEQVIEKDEEELRDGDQTGITSKSALRKARSEEMAKSDKAKNDLSDIYLRQEENDYIIHVASPFNVQAMSKGQASLLNQPGLKELYFDATGSVIRKQPNQKRILYYVGVIGTEIGTIPLFEMATSVHTVASIKNFLTNIRSLIVKENGKWPVIDRVTTDFSMAILNAFSTSWNDIDLIKYINLCYSDSHAKLIKLCLCSAHLIKMVKNKVYKCFKDWETKQFIVSAIASLITADSFILFSKLITSLFILLKSEYFGENCHTAKETIRYI